MASDDEAEMHRLADEVEAKIKPLLSGLDPRLQGFICADLLAIHIAGYPPNTRDKMEIMNLELVRDLLAIYAAHIDRKPQGST